jgi:hypothetical protein
MMGEKEAKELIAFVNFQIGSYPEMLFPLLSRAAYCFTISTLRKTSLRSSSHS